MKATLQWLYWLACQLTGAAFYWLPVHTHHVWIPPAGLTVAFALCMLKAWRWRSEVSTIKVLPGRTTVDRWPWPFNALWGNPEDGVSGVYAFGPSWTDRYNPTRSRFKALLWNLRNWFAGFNYVTWPTWLIGTPPLFTHGPIKLGWQKRYGRNVMVCGF